MNVEQYTKAILKYLREAVKNGYNYGMSKKMIMEHLEIEPKTKGYYLFNWTIHRMMKLGKIKQAEVGGEKQRGFYVLWKRKNAPPR